MILAIAFICGVILYPVASILDLFNRGIPVTLNSKGPAQFSDLLLAIWYSIKQIVFWVGGWIVPTAYLVDAGGRAHFSGFNISSIKFLFNYAIVISVLVLPVILLKRDSIKRICNIREKALRTLSVFLFLFAYSFVIAYGRALPRGLDYVTGINIYYSYIACLSVAIAISLYFYDGDLVTPTSNEIPKLIKPSALGLILLSGLTVFSANSTYKLASAYRYSFSPPIFDLIQSVEHFSKTKSGAKNYFVVDKSCSGNSDLPWFNAGDYRKNSGFFGHATIADVLFPEMSWELNKTNLSDSDIHPSTINCTKVQASSILDNYGPSGLLSADNPGWHARTPVTFPQALDVDFGYARKVENIYFLPQQGLTTRAPKSIEIEISDDHTEWRKIYKGELGCESDSEDWRNVTFEKSVTARYMKIVVLSNCGDANLLTLRGLRFD